MTLGALGQPIMPVCDLSSGPLLANVQLKLGVPATGFWDAATQAAYTARTGERCATAAQLVPAAFNDVNAACANVVLPKCPGFNWKKYLLIAGGVYVAWAVLGGSIAVWHHRKQKATA